jgi:hypothetical protein
MARYTFVEYHNVTGGRRIPSAICTVESRVKTPEGFRRLFFKLKPDAPGYGFYKVHLTDEGAQIFCMGILAMAFIRDTSGSTDV